MAIKTVEMTRQIRDKYHEETKNLSLEEQREFFSRKAEETARRVATRKDVAKR